MKFNFQFSNLCGTVYRQGNILFTPDGNSVLSPVGNRVSVLDLVNHKSRTLPFENRRNISRLCLSPDGSTLISVDENGGALLVNFHKAVVLCQFQFKAKVLDLQFSPDMKFIAVTSEQHIQIWKAPPLVSQFRPFHLIRTFTGHYDDVLCLTWSPDSKFLISGSRDMACRLYSAEPIKGYLPITLTGHRNHIVGAFFRYGLKPGMDESLYTVAKDGALFTWKFVPIDQDEKGRRFGVGRSFKKRDQIEAISDDAHWIAKCNVVMVKKHYFQQNHAKVVCAALHHSNKISELLVVGFDTGVFGLFEMPEFNMIHTLSISQKRITSVAINTTGEWLAFGSEKLGQLLVWEWQSETYILKQQGHFFDMNSIAYSPDGQLIATGGDDGKVKLWNASTGFCFVTFSEHTGPVNQVVFSSKGNVVVSSSLDGTVRAFDLVRYRNFRTFTSPEPTQFTCLALDNSGEMVVAGSLDPFEVYVWSLRTARLLDVLSGHTGPLSGVLFNPAHPYLISSSWDKTVRIWDVYNRKVAVESLDHSGEVLCVAVRPDGDQVCSADLTGQLYFWDPQAQLKGRKDIMGGRRRDDAREAKNATHSLAFTSLCYSADGKCILAGGNSKSLDGILTYLNSKNMTEAGPLALIDDEDGGSGSDKEDFKDNSLPGAKRSDFSKRKTPLVARTKCVKFSPDGRQWAAASTEGLMIYSLDQNLYFDPQDLDMEVTPENAQILLEEKQYAKALVMALRLNEQKLLKTMAETVPMDEILSVVSSIPVHYIERILVLIGEGINSSPHLQFYLTWVQTILTIHGKSLEKNSMKMLRYLTKQKVKNVGSSASRLSSTKDVDDKEPKSSKGGPVDGKRSKQSSTSVENIKNRKRKS
eukprot:jgi/Bigna1/87845/estExt_fgenesh1_pg.C_250009